MRKSGEMSVPQTGGKQWGYLTKHASEKGNYLLIKNILGQGGGDNKEEKMGLEKYLYIGGRNVNNSECEGRLTR